MPSFSSKNKSLTLAVKTYAKPDVRVSGLAASNSEKENRR